MQQRLANITHEVLGWNDAVVKHELCRVGCSHARLVVDLLTNAVSRHAGFHQEGRHLDPPSVVFARASVDPHDICWRSLLIDATVRDPHLSAVEHPRTVVTLLSGG